MRKVLILLAILLVACCPCRNTSSTSVEKEVQRDSIYITRLDTVRIVERDTVYKVRLEQYHERAQVTEQHSYLENPYCTSTADVNEEGALTHSLNTRDSALMKLRTASRLRVVRDTVILYRFKDRAVDNERVVIREVKKAAWYDKIIRIVCLGLLALVIWQNRKKIMSVIRLWRI